MSDNEVTPESKPRRRAAGRPAGPPVDAPAEKADKAPAKAAAKKKAPAVKKAPIAVPVFQSAPVTAAPAKKKAVAKSASTEETLSVAKKGQSKKSPTKKASSSESADAPESTSNEASESGEERSGGNNRNRNRNRRGGKNKNRAKSNNAAEGSESEDDSVEVSEEDSTESAESASARKRSRKRTRDGSDNESGSTRLDAKRNRRRDGRDAGRRRAPILTESEFLARRENVERVMVVRQQGARTQIAVLEDGIVVEHYINQSSSGSLVGNVYLGRVQNVLPGMEAAFVDIGKGRNAVLYAGEVNWDAAGLDGQPKKIETALKSGDPVLVQVTKDPVGQKGARLTSQISLPGRFLVYVPNNPMTGISRKLPDRERSRLKTILKAVVPEDAGVIVRTASEGASEEELGRDVARLAAQWTDIEAKSASPPTMLYGEPDISIKVVRDIFNEDVKKLIVSGADAWETVEQYVSYVAPDLADRLEKYVGTTDVFTEYRIDEQIAKALDRKVYLPSGGSLVIDRTEAMTVVDVNTGKFIGQGGSLEQTVTKNNMEAAEEIVRQLRLRDIGGIIVIDFIDMVLESNRDQVIRRLIECLGRDRTKHQVAEVTSLGLVQMTRKRIGAGLLEVFSESCDHCQGRGAVVNMEGHDASKTPKNKGKKGNHDHSNENSTDSTPDSTPEEPVSV
jgi:ribonuclease E